MLRVVRGSGPTAASSAQSSIWHATIARLLRAKSASITNTIIRPFVSLCYSLSVSARYVPPLELQGSGGAAHNDFGDSVWLCLLGTYPGPLTRVELLG